MFHKKTSKFLSLALAVLMLLLSACSGGEKDNNSSKPEKLEAWAVTEYDKNEIIDKNGQYIIEKLTPTKVSELKAVNGKQIIYHLGQPYLFYAVHHRYDHLLSAKLDDATVKSTFDEGMRLSKEAGFETVVLYLNWERMISKDGKTFDFTELEYQYSVAKKYDMKIMLNWFGYDVCGFGGYRAWQKNDLEKYPPLKDEKGNIIYGTGFAEGKMIPDLSAKAFIDDEVYAINQLCAWLNVNDTDRRTVGIQIENEINNDEGGHGLWFSQYSNLINLINELAKAVKQGPYSMLTYVNLMGAGKDDIIEGRDFKEQVKGMIDLEYLDITGYDIYTEQLDIRADAIEQGDNPYLMVEFGPGVWCVPSQTNTLLQKGYGIGFYQLVMYNEKATSTGGLYRFGTTDNPYVKRDGTMIHQGGTYVGRPEILADEFFVMNRSVNALSQIIAVTPNKDMIFFNRSMKAVRKENKKLSDTIFKFSTDCGNDLYGGTGLMLKSQKEENTYYAYSSKKSEISPNNKEILSATSGIYKDGEWIASEKAEILNNSVILEAGKAYRFEIK